MEINHPEDTNNVDNILNDFTLIIDKANADFNNSENKFNWLEKYHPKTLDDCLLKLEDKF